MDKSVPLAVLISDIHLSEKAPVARSAEPDWFAAMARPLRVVKRLAKKMNVPVICAGDVFDRAQPTSRLINFALDELPAMYSVPGQHDLPFHEYAAMELSAYGTMVKVGRINTLDPFKYTHIPAGNGLISAFAFPWNHAISPVDSMAPGLRLAVVHEYIWADSNTSYPGAKEEQSVSGFRKRLKGYDCALFGDNHKGFLAKSGKCTVYNHGGFMSRKTDEREATPGYGILYSDGSVKHVPFDTSDDRWTDDIVSAKSVEEVEGHMADFIKELKTAGHTDLDFREALHHYFKTYDVSPGARKILLNSTNG